MAALERVQQGVRDRERVAARPTQPRQTIYRVTPPWEGRSKHFSKEFEAFALTLMREMPVKKAGEILGNRPAAVADAPCARGGGAGAGRLVEVVWVGADEMNRRKGLHRCLQIWSTNGCSLELRAKTPGCGRVLPGIAGA